MSKQTSKKNQILNKVKETLNKEKIEKRKEKRQKKKERKQITMMQQYSNIQKSGCHNVRQCEMNELAFPAFWSDAVDDV